MIGEENIKQMAKAAVFEERHKDLLDISQFFKWDYVTFHILKTWICTTIAFIIAVASYVLYRIEMGRFDLSKFDFNTNSKILLLVYIIYSLIFAMIALLVYISRYEKAKKQVGHYQRLLKRILSAQEEIEKAEKMERVKKDDEFMGA